MHTVVSGSSSPGTAGTLRLFLAVLIPVFALYFSTADRTIPYHIDPFTNVLSAATIGDTGSPILSAYGSLADPDRFAVFGWVVDSPRGPVSQYPPGTALLTSLFYALANDPGLTIDVYAFNDPDAAPVSLGVPPLWPAALVAALTSSLAVAFTALSVREATRSTRWAIAAAVVLASGSGLWLNGGYQLWQHGPASMWIAGALWAASRSRWLASGLLAGLGVLTRPPVALISAGIGIVSSLKDRSWRPVLLHGAGASLGTALLLSYNYWLFDTLSISGGYGSNFTDNLTGADLGWYIRNVAGGFFSVDRGLFVWSPILAIGALGIPIVWRRAPGWATGGILGALALLLVQFRLNRYSGGDGFYSYRYPLEAIVASTPMLALSVKRLWETTSPFRLLVPATAAASIVFHLIAAIREFLG